MTTRTVKYIKGDEFSVANDDSRWIIEGYASTDAIDSYNEIVEPEAFRNSLSKFKEFPVILLNHRWFEVPVGKVVEAEIRERGLWVRVEISKSAPQVWQLIQEKTLKAFSIGFFGVKVEENLEGDEPDVWKEVELVEISVVNIPANREALFTVAGEKGLDLSQFSQKTRTPSTTHTKEGGSMDPITLDQVKEVAGDAVKTALPTLNAATKSIAEDEVKRAIAPIEVKANDSLGLIKQVQDTIKGCTTQAQLEEVKDKVTGDLNALQAKVDRLSATGLPNLRDTLPEIPGIDVFEMFNKSLADEMSQSVGYVKAITRTPEEMHSGEGLRELARKWQAAHDIIYTLDFRHRLQHGQNYRGPKTLKAWPVYEKLTAEYRKAMDSSTATEGAEWIPTGYSAELIGRVDLALTVANKFRSFPQPTASYVWPVKSTRGTAYKTGENTGDSGTKITASTPKTGNVTFTAVQLAMRVLFSQIFIEDSIVPALPFVLDEIAETLARGIDDACINGDTSATHQDSNVTDPSDVRTSWSGLRYKALNGTSSSAETTSMTLANLRTVWKLMLDYGGNPSDLHLFLSTRDFVQLLGDTNISNVANFGSQSPIANGQLMQVYGIGISTSAFCQTNLNASGVYDGTTTTKSAQILVNKRCYMMGDRRIVTLETNKDIETQQTIAVGTVRKDFQEIISGQAPVVIGYNMA